MTPRKYKNLTGWRIRAARRQHEPPLSQADLARCMVRRGVHLDQGAISRIENRSRMISDYELVAMARCLGVAVSDLCK